MKNFFSKEISCSFLLTILIFYVIPIFIVNYNYIYFGDINIYFVIFVFICVVFLFFIVLLFLLYFLKGKLKQTVFEFLRFSLFFFILTGFLLPLTKDGIQIDVTAIPWNIWNTIFAIIGACTLSVISKRSQYEGKMLIAAAVFILANGFLSTFILIQRTSVKKDDNIFIASSTRNIFTVSFDGLNRDVSLRVLEENPKFQEAFKDFTVFKNAITSANVTLISIASELSGILDVKEVFDTEQNMAELTKSEQTIANRLEKDGYTVSTYGQYSNFFKNEERRHYDNSLDVRFVHAIQIDRIIEIYQYTIARTLSSFFVDKFFTENVVHALHRIFYIPEGDDPGTALRLKLRKHQGDHWDKNTVLSLLDWDMYLSKLQVGTDTPVSHFGHFLFTHHPVDFDASCEYRSDSKEWFDRSQNPVGYKNEIFCAFTQFSRFIEKLKSLGIYDNSLIILKSDHGAPPEYFDYDQVDSFSIYENRNLGLARHVPFLAIKNFQENHPSLRYDIRPAVLTDLAKTICTQILKPEKGCDEYSGYDLLDTTVEIPETAETALIYPRNKESNAVIDTQISRKVKRLTNFIPYLNQLFTSEFLKQAPSCQVRMNITEGQRYYNGFTDNNLWITWHNNNAVYAKTKVPQCVFNQIIIEGINPSTLPSGLEIVLSRVNTDGLSTHVLTKTIEKTETETFRIAISLPDQIFDNNSGGEILIVIQPVNGTERVQLQGLTYENSIP